MKNDFSVLMWTFLSIPSKFHGELIPTHNSTTMRVVAGKKDFSVQICTFHAIPGKAFMFGTWPPHPWVEDWKHDFSVWIWTFHLIPRRRPSFKLNPQGYGLGIDKGKGSSTNIFFLLGIACNIQIYTEKLCMEAPLPWDGVGIDFSQKCFHNKIAKMEDISVQIVNES